MVQGPLISPPILCNATTHQIPRSDERSVGPIGLNVLLGYWFVSAYRLVSTGAYHLCDGCPAWPKPLVIPLPLRFPSPRPLDFVMRECLEPLTGPLWLTPKKQVYPAGGVAILLSKGRIKCTTGSGRRMEKVKRMGWVFLASLSQQRKHFHFLSRPSRPSLLLPPKKRVSLHDVPHKRSKNYITHKAITVLVHTRFDQNHNPIQPSRECRPCNKKTKGQDERQKRNNLDW